MYIKAALLTDRFHTGHTPSLSPVAFIAYILAFNVYINAVFAYNGTQSKVNQIRLKERERKVYVYQS